VLHRPSCIEVALFLAFAHCARPLRIVASSLPKMKAHAMNSSVSSIKFMRI
jgi:hypothetical protein